MLADDPAIQHVSAPVSYLMFHGAYDTPKFRFCSPHRRPPPMVGFHLMPYPCKQGMKPTLSLLKSHSAFALHSCPLLLSPRHQFPSMYASPPSDECRRGFLITNQGEIHERTTTKPSPRRVGNDAPFLYPDFVCARRGVSCRWHSARADRRNSK